MSKWKTELHDDGQVRIWPLGDLREHRLDGLPCWCEPILTEDGVEVHNSADHREDYETRRRKTN